MARTVVDQFADFLVVAGVRRIYGIVGDTSTGSPTRAHRSLRRQGKIEWIHVRHEEVAAFAAGAEAHLTWRTITFGVAKPPWGRPSPPAGRERQPRDQRGGSAPATATAQISPPTFAGGAVVEGDRGLNDRLMAAAEFFNGDPVVHTWTYKLDKAA
jgi:hypothetical protein